ncbi:SIR2 family protein [Pseudomonas tremae]|uniref:SIR2 family protein n=1 Tax=Pseudomonas tremae TaxID=200454 RepID=UPI003F65F38D
MTRKTLIFGNGLGMALDPDHFSLARALEDVWNHPRHLPDDKKLMVGRCVDNDGLPPNGEEQLDTLHIVVAACNMLNKIGDDDVHWLTADAQSFPKAVAQYIHRVASDLHLYDGDLPNDFLEPLFAFLRETNSNIATLNYDRLLYGALVDEGLMAGGYSAYLVDGMVDAGFAEHRLERLWQNDFGYYLHLHGSPLFYDDRHGVAHKMTRDQLNMSSRIISNHIVLTHVTHKRSVIGASEVLSTYWDYLQKCCHEAREIIVFGYSGFDTHLNDVLAAFARSTPMRIIEWRGAGTLRERERFWQDILRTDDFDLDRRRNILTFTDW